MPKPKVLFFEKPTCTTCRKAKAYLQHLGADLETRNLDKDRLSETELDQMIGDRDYKTFLSARNELYRTRKMGENPPSRKEAIQLMAKEPNLIRRPVVIRGNQVILGYDEDAYKKLLE